MISVEGFVWPTAAEQAESPELLRVCSTLEVMFDLLADYRSNEKIIGPLAIDLAKVIAKLMETDFEPDGADQEKLHHIMLNLIERTNHIRKIQ